MFRENNKSSKTTLTCLIDKCCLLFLNFWTNVKVINIKCFYYDTSV